MAVALLCVITGLSVYIMVHTDPKAVKHSPSAPKQLALPKTNIAQTDGYGLPKSYSIAGNHIIDSGGNIFVPHGVNRSSTEWSCTGKSVDGSHAGVPASDFVTMHTKWKANIVRIPLNQDMWLAGAAEYCPSYQATIGEEVQRAHQTGLRVILDLHWSDAGNLSNSGACAVGTGGACVGQQCMPDQNSLLFWQQVAAAYKTDQSTWFDLYNEPRNITWAIWRDGGNGGAACNYTTVGMQQLVDAVRATGANNIVLAGGLKSASNLAGVPLLSGGNVAYSVHSYASYNNPDDWTIGGWDTEFGNRAKTVPVIATEFGKIWCSGGVSRGSSTYDQAVLDYFRTHGIGYAAFSWFSYSCKFPTLIADSVGGCANAGCLVEADLQKFASGEQAMTIPGIKVPVQLPLSP